VLHFIFEPADVKNCVRGLCLRVDNFILAIIGNGPAARDGGEKYLRVKCGFFRYLNHDRFVPKYSTLEKDGLAWLSPRQSIAGFGAPRSLKDVTWGYP
jgi:hypothetical protein